jgi:hypothetical protein
MNTTSETIMSVAYILFMVSVIPGIRAAWKNRKNLNGFSRFMVTATALGLLLTQVALVMDMAYMPVLIGLPNMTYWMILMILTWRN